MRPRRLYIDTKTHKPYYLIKGEKVYIKVPKKMTMNQLQKVNIKNIIKIGTVKRVKRRTGRRLKGKYSKKITQAMTHNGEIQPGLPTYLYQEQKFIPELATAGRRPQLVLMNGSTNLPKAQVIPNALIMALPVNTPLIRTRFNDAISEGRKQQVEPIYGAEQMSRFKTSPIKKSEKEKQERKEDNFILSNPGIAAFDLRKKKVLPPIKSELPIKPVMSTREKAFQERQLGIKIPDHRVTTIFRKSEEFKDAEKESILNPSPPLTPDTIERMDNQRIAKEHKGKGNNSDSDDEGLYDNEIEKIAKKRMKHFVPCIASDQTSDLLQYVKRGDKEFSFVINTNPSKSNGSGKDGYPVGHWTCVFIDNRDDYPSCEFFDPLVQGKIPIAVVNIMRKIAVKMNPEKMFKYKQNMIRRQNFMTSHCGQFCIQFLENRMNGESFSEASGYDEYLKNHQPIDDSSEGEEDLEKVLPKYKSYI